MAKNKSWHDIIHQYSDSWWYCPLIGLIAGIDFFLFVVPTDAIVLGAAILAPKRWLSLTLCVSIGSSIGALLFAALLEKEGLPYLLHHFPGMEHTHAWLMSEHLMHRYGDWAIWLVALGPVIQHPTLAMAAAAHINLFKLFFLVLAGRIPKYAFYTLIAGRAPAIVERFIKRKNKP